VTSEQSRSLRGSLLCAAGYAKHMNKVELSEDQIIDQLADRLAQDYPKVPADEVVRVVHDKHAHFTGRPVRDFVPLFVERHAKKELTKLSAKMRPTAFMPPLARATS
jgi:hypothetical protein